MFSLVRLLARALDRVELAIVEGLRQVRDWRLRACPSCKSRRLTRIHSALWTGIPGTVLCSTYRCRDCGEELFTECHGAPVTMADHAVWCETKQMRPLELLPSAGLPEARAKRTGRRTRSGQ